MSSIVSNHDYPSYESLGNVFNLSAATSFPSTPSVTILSCSGQVGNHDPYNPSSTPSTHAQQFSGTHTEQFEAALQNVEKALSAAQPKLGSKELWGGAFSMMSYHVRLEDQGEQLAMAEVARRVVGVGGNRPAWSAIRVQGLLPEGCVVEVVVQAAYKRED